MRVEVKQQTDRLALTLHATHALIPVRQQCRGGGTSGSAMLHARLLLEGGMHPPVQLHWQQPWECGKGRLQTR